MVRTCTILCRNHLDSVPQGCLPRSKLDHLYDDSKVVLGGQKAFAGWSIHSTSFSEVCCVGRDYLLSHVSPLSIAPVKRSSFPALQRALSVFKFLPRVKSASDEALTTP